MRGKIKTASETTHSVIRPLLNYDRDCQCTVCKVALHEL